MWLSLLAQLSETSDNPKLFHTQPEAVHGFKCPQKHQSTEGFIGEQSLTSCLGLLLQLPSPGTALCHAATRSRFPDTEVKCYR